MELRQLEAVVAVVDHGSFSAAAEALTLAQPSLSRRIATLEGELGVALFDRVGRGVRLTAAGRALVDPARRALHEGRQVRAVVEAVAGLSAGHLEIGGLPLVLIHLSPLVGAFRRAHPGVTIGIVGAADRDELVAMVASARCDIGLSELPVPADELVATPLGRQDLVAVLPPGTDLGAAVLDRRTRPVTVAVEGLVGLPMVALPPGTATRLLVEELFAQVGAVPSVSVTTDQRDALVPLVLAGAGMAFVPDRMAADAAARGAVVVQPRPGLRRRLGLLRRRGSPTPAAAAFEALAVADARRHPER